MHNPLVSVILPVFNGESFIRESIDSILAQSISDFELIVINDGSIDGTKKILETYSDPRLKILHQSNLGLPSAINNGLAISSGRYLARQDADDVSLPFRLERQVSFLERNLQCGLVGSAGQIWVNSEPSGRFHDHPSDPCELEFELIFNNPFIHTSWMFRREVLSQVGVYCTDISRQPPEDYEYVSRVSRKYDVANLAERLVIYRETDNSLSSQIRPENLKKGNSFSSRLALISSENLMLSARSKGLTDDILNFGAIYHSSFDLVKSTPKLAPIKKLLIRACENICLKHNCRRAYSLLLGKTTEFSCKFFKYEYERKLKNYSYLAPLLYIEYRLKTYLIIRSFRLKAVMLQLRQRGKKYLYFV